jgi:hypothetical protein
MLDVDRLERPRADMKDNVGAPDSLGGEPIK